jgi:AsmA protein
VRIILWAVASTIAILAVIAATVVLVGPLLISTAVVRDQAFAKVENATGYRLRVSGPVRLSMFPSIDLVADDVGIARTASADGAEFVTARRLRLGLVLSALLGGKVQMTEVTLIDPVIGIPQPTNAGAGVSGPVEDGNSAAKPLNSLNLDRLVIKNGVVMLPSTGNTPGKRIEALMLEASLHDASGPLSFDMAARYDGKPVHAAGSIDRFGEFAGGGPSPITLAVDAPAYLPDRATLSGTAAYHGDSFSLSQFSAASGADNAAGNLLYQDDTLKLDINARYQGKPVHVAGSIGSLGAILDGGSAPIGLAIDAPDYLQAAATVTGAVSYAEDTLTLAQFTARSGDNAVAGSAAYNDKDNALTLTDFTAKVGADTVAGSATYRDDTLNLDVQAEHKGEPIRVAGSIGNVRQALDGAQAPAKLAIDAPAHLPAEATVAGAVSYKDDTLTLTDFTAQSAKHALTGSATYKDNTLTLNPITITTGGQTATGAVTADLAGDVLGIGASLRAETLDLNRLLADLGAKPASAAPEAAGNDEDPAAGGEAKTDMKADTKAKIDFSSLKSINANLALNVGQLVYGRFKIDSAAIHAKLYEGKLSAEIPSLALYNGSGTGMLEIDAGGEVPTQHIQLSLANVDAYPFLDDAVDFQSIEGKAAIDVDLTASGGSQPAMVSTLNGTAKLAFADGALRGLNVVKMLRNLTTGILTGWQYSEEAKTAFNALGASFTLANGQAQTEDLRLSGPLVSMGGGGTVDLPAETLKFRVNPLMLASVEGDGGKNRALGFPVPVAISGPWAEPLIYPDIVGILDQPVAAYQKLNKLGGGLIAMPANLIGVDTGGKGLVETGVALPAALAKGAIKGVGAIVGNKPQDDAATAATGAEGATVPDGGAVAATGAEAEAKPAPAPAVAPPANPLMQGMFDTKPQQGATPPPATTPPAETSAREVPAKAAAEKEPAEAPATDGWAADAAADDTDAKPEPASAPSTPLANPLMQGMFGN